MACLRLFANKGLISFLGNAQKINLVYNKTNKTKNYV